MLLPRVPKRGDNYMYARGGQNYVLPVGCARVGLKAAKFPETWTVCFMAPGMRAWGQSCLHINCTCWVKCCQLVKYSGCGRVISKEDSIELMHTLDSLSFLTRQICCSSVQASSMRSMKGALPAISEEMLELVSTRTFFVTEGLVIELDWPCV